MPRSLQLPLGLLALLAAILLAYSTALQGGFIWDDDSYVTDNATLRSPDALRQIWLEPEASPQYYPMVFSLLWAEYQLWELEPFGYHLVNVLLHALNAALVFAVCRRLAIPGAWLAAALFGLHPVHVESVAWVTELKNVLSGSFYLLSFWAYLHFAGLGESRRERPRAAAYGASLLGFVLALFSKTVTVSLPAVLLVVQWWKRGRLALRDVSPLLPFFAVGLYMGLRTARLEKEHVGAEGIDWSLSFLERVYIAGRALWFYVAKLAWPSELIFSYPRWEIDTGSPGQALFPLAALLLGLALWLLRERIGRGPLAAALFFAMSLFPALGFFDVYPMRYSFVADHFQYLASLGPIVLFAACVAHGASLVPAPWRSALPLAAAALLAVLALLTWQQGKIYADRETLFSDVIEKNPSSWMAHLNRANVYTREERFELALADYSRSIELRPRQLGSYINRGSIYMLQRRFREAMQDFEQAIRFNPRSEEPHINIGLVHLQLGRRREALEHLDLAAELNPGNPGVFSARAQAYYFLRRYDEARADAERAVALGGSLPAPLARSLRQHGGR